MHAAAFLFKRKCSKPFWRAEADCAARELCRSSFAFPAHDNRRRSSKISELDAGVELVVGMLPYINQNVLLLDVAVHNPATNVEVRQPLAELRRNAREVVDSQAGAASVICQRAGVAMLGQHATYSTMPWIDVLKHKGHRQQRAILADAAAAVIAAAAAFVIAVAAAVVVLGANLALGSDMGSQDVRVVQPLEQRGFCRKHGPGRSEVWAEVLDRLTAQMAKALESNSGNIGMGAGKPADRTVNRMAGGKAAAVQEAMVALPRLLQLLLLVDPRARPSARDILASTGPNAHLLETTLGQR